MRIIRIILFRVLNSPGTLSLALHPFIIFPSNFLSSTFVTTEMLNFLHFCPNRVALNPLLLCKSSLPVCKAFHPLSLEHEENVPTSPSVKSCLTTFKDIPQNSELIPLSSLTLLLIILIASVCVCVCARVLYWAEIPLNTRSSYQLLSISQNICRWSSGQCTFAEWMHESNLQTVKC